MAMVLFQQLLYLSVAPFCAYSMVMRQLDINL